MNNEPWIGDATVGDSGGCSYGDPHCGKPATLHILSESAITGLLTLSTCDKHASIARAAGPYLGEHAFGAGCLATPSIWYPEACEVPA